MIQNRHSPIIVGERYDLAETLALKYSGDSGGLLPKPDYQTALLSMSGYDGKNPAATLDGMRSLCHERSLEFLLVPTVNSNYGATDLNVSRSGYGWSNNSQYSGGRPSQPSIDMMYAQSGLSERSTDQTGYGSSAPYQARNSYDSGRSQLTDDSFRQAPEIKSYNPDRGTGGTHIHIYLRCDYDLQARPAVVLSLLFASKRVLIDITRLETSGASFEYVILATAPQYSETGASTPQVQLRLQLQEETGQEAGLVDIGRFEYLAGQLQSTPPTITRKRKLSDESATSTPVNSYRSYPYTSNMSSAYTNNLQSVDLNSMHRRFTPYGRAQHQQRYRESMPAMLPSQSFMQPSLNHASTWSPNFTSLSGRTPSFGGATQALSSSDSNPVLVRTTTLQQTGSPSFTPSGNSTGGFNPYSYPQKAVLKIHGDLNSMTEDWTPEEWASNRRLVQFSRSQNKSTVNVEFAPVAPEDRQPNSICISCIWWEERQECFATSVDTIFLLESLIAMRFTVEEKNRIRRNLEGFHPETVSKGKADSEEFFKIIMGFPNPKPRNIEKDVKVFPWKILSHALKKIISKYVSSAVTNFPLAAPLTHQSQSASYSSTVGALGGTPRTSMSYQYDSPGHYSNLSSRSASDSTASGGYGPQALKSSMSPHAINTSHFTPNLNDNVPLSGGSLPSLASDYSNYTDSPYLAPQNPSYHHVRAGSATEQYDAPRVYKRPRANTSNATLYSQHEAANLLGAMSRSYSDHGSGSHARLPSLAESYVLPSTESRFTGVSDGQVTSVMNASAGGSMGAGGYDFSSYVDPPTTSSGNIQEFKNEDAGAEDDDGLQGPSPGQVV